MLFDLEISPPAKKTPLLVTYRNNLSIESYLEDLTSQNWQLVYDCTCLDNEVDMWEKLLLEVVNSHMPTRQKRVKSKPSAHNAKSNIANEEDESIKKRTNSLIMILCGVNIEY